jgi:hypothetical protein
MSEDPKSFTVKDRRHFTPEGESREPDEPSEAVPSRPVAAPPDDEPPPRPAVDRAAGDAVSFGQFVLSLAAQAGLLLAGKMGSESPAEALAEARSLISILEMLKDKTEGRRTPEEEEILDGTLYELRMGYVARAREVGE